MNEISLSVVSHRQNELVKVLLEDVARYSANLDVFLTRNVAEGATIQIEGLHNFRQFENPSKKGFGANHNAAFRYCDSPYFCVVNPDVRFLDDPFQELLNCMDDPQVGLVAPGVINSAGTAENNARYFPTPINLVSKMLCLNDGRYLVMSNAPLEVDWVAGMFMFFRAEAFLDIGGFDEQFFLYYEDVDICARLWKAGWKVMLHPGVTVVHDAQRASHRNLKYMRWHFASMMRYFYKHLGRLPRIDKMI